MLATAQELVSWESVMVSLATAHLLVDATWKPGHVIRSLGVVHIRRPGWGLHVRAELATVQVVVKVFVMT